VQQLTYAQEEYVSKPTQQRVVNIILEKAEVALQKANYSEANELITSASEIAKDSTIYAETQLLKVSYYNQTGQLNNAKTTIDLLTPYFDTTSIDYARLLLLKSDFLMNSNLLVEAEEAILKSQIILAQTGDKKLREILQLKQAGLDIKFKNYNQARKTLEELLPVLLKTRQFYSVAKAQLDLFQITSIAGEYVTAKNYLTESIELSEKYAFNTLLKESYLLYSELLKKEGEFEKSITYLEKYTFIYNRETASVQKTASVIELEELKKKNIELTVSNNEKTQKLKGVDTSYILLCVFITLLSLLTLSLFKNNKLRAKSNHVLEDKNSALIDERDRAKDATKIKADFLSTITHELRTPMYAVTGLTHLLLEKDPRNDQKEHLETLQSSGEYLLSLIDNILDFNKLEANKVELETIPFDLYKRVNDISLSLKGQATDRNNNLHIDYDNSIPSRLQGDPVKISQILINLIGNAIKFTQDGDIYIRVQKVNTRSGKCLINFEIEDNGKGISEEKQIAIFENFTQEGSSTTREYGGTGLGLAIVKNLVTLMGGDIHLKSKVNGGSKFSFEIWFELPDSNKFYDENQYPDISNNKRFHPASPGQETDTNDVLKTPVTDAANSSTKMDNNKLQKPETSKDGVLNEKKATPTELSNKQILIVEDNKINQMITRKILEGKNFSCEVANNGEEAVQAAKSKKYDLILMDIHMPIKDGKEATKEIRTFDREIPIIALTAVTLHESEKEFYEIGFDDIIPKPFKMDEFFKKIQKVFTNYEVL
jgi:signal transduction histidine kinase/ActR/RegA family two-component response regulator